MAPNKETRFPGVPYRHKSKKKTQNPAVISNWRLISSSKTRPEIRSKPLDDLNRATKQIRHNCSFLPSEDSADSHALIPRVR